MKKLYILLFACHAVLAGEINPPGDEAIDQPAPVIQAPAPYPLQRVPVVTSSCEERTKRCVSDPLVWVLPMGTAAGVTGGILCITNPCCACGPMCATLPLVFGASLLVPTAFRIAKACREPRQ